MSEEGLPRYRRRDGTCYPPGRAGLFEWARDLDDPAKRIVQQTVIGNVEVSTVWIGLEGPKWPGLDWDTSCIFETMVFGGKYDGVQERYQTEQDAIEGHKVVCEMVRESQA